jgi:hypothetical protein
MDGGKGFIDHLIRVTDRVLYRLGRKISNSLLTKARFAMVVV